MNGIGVDPWVGLLHAAMAITNLSLKATSIDLGLGDRPAYLSKVMNGEKPFPYRRLTTAAIPLQRAFCVAWARELGLAVGGRAEVFRMAEALLELGQIQETESIAVLRRADEWLARFANSPAHLAALERSTR